jgi:hypothetical protein
MAGGEVMILSLEDFAIIITMLSPVYCLAYQHTIKITQLELRLSKVLRLTDEN